MENNTYNRSKEILLQASLAGKGARAGQGKGGGIKKEKDWNQWLLTFYTEALCDGFVHCWKAQWSLHQNWLFTWLIILVIWRPPPVIEAALSRNEMVIMGARRKVSCTLELLCLWHVGCIYRKANVESKIVYLQVLAIITTKQRSCTDDLAFWTEVGWRS